MDDNETLNDNFLECPHCGHEHKDSWELDPESEDGETDCDSCGKPILWSRRTSVSYSGKPKP